MLDADADIHAADGLGRTVLDRARSCERDEVIALIERRASAGHARPAL